MGTQAAAGACQPGMFAGLPSSWRACVRRGAPPHILTLVLLHRRAEHGTWRSLPRRRRPGSGRARCGAARQPAAALHLVRALLLLREPGVRAWRSQVAAYKSLLSCSEARVTYPSAEEAEIVCRSLDVDREVRTLTTYCPYDIPHSAGSTCARVLAAAAARAGHEAARHGRGRPAHVRPLVPAQGPAEQACEACPEQHA